MSNVCRNNNKISQFFGEHIACIFVETKYVSHVNLQNHDDFKKWLKIKMVSPIRNWLFYNNLLTDFVNN